MLGLRSPQTGNVKLLLSANQSHPRAQLTALNRENPDAPPMFCMLLRKHLTGGRLLAISQPPMERIVDLRFEATNELGDRVERRLVLEAISRRANLLLLDGEGRILDCIRRVDSGLGSAGVQGRTLQPGMFYRLPPAVEKADPAALSHEELEGLFSAAPEGSRGSSWLLDTFGGLSPLILPGAVLPRLGRRQPDLWRSGGKQPSGPAEAAGAAAHDRKAKCLYTNNADKGGTPFRLLVHPYRPVP